MSLAVCGCGARITKPGATACFRHRPRKRPQAAPKRRRIVGHRDPVTEAVYLAVIALHGEVCAGPAAGLPGDCAGRLELDHVLNGGMAYRGPSEVGNLIPLCQAHHRYKTEHARTSRRLLVAVISARTAR